MDSKEKGSNTGWAWKPDAKTKRAIARGNRKLARHRRRFDRSQPTEVTTMAKKQPARKKAPAKRAPAKKAPAAKASNVISLKELLRNTDIDPKAARRKLRNADISGHDPKARWEFTPAQAKKAKTALGI